MTLAALTAALLLAAAPSGAKGKAKRSRSPGAITDVQPRAGAPLPVRPVAVRPFDQTGVVRTATRQRAYLDAGSKEGLAVGQTLQLSRKGQPVAQCTVEVVAERNATCIGPGIRPGDTFPVNPRATGAAPVALPAKPEIDEQARRLTAVQSLAFVPIESKAKPSVEVAERTRRYAAGLSHFSYFSSETGGVSLEQVYATVRDAEAFRGALLNLDIAAVARSAPSSSERLEEGKRALVWVREASLAWAQPQSPWRLAAGRVLPWVIPGGPTFDGVQAGWRRGAGELGLFGGGVGNPMTTAPGFDRATAGGYWTWEGASEGPAGKYLFRNAARLAYVKLPGGKNRVEAETTAQAWLGRAVDVSAQARFGTGDYAAPGKLDAARLDLGFYRPGTYSLAGGFRYDENRIPDDAALSVMPGRTRHAWGSATWEKLGWLQIRAAGGFAHDVGASQTRSWVGPELAAPRLFGRWGGMAVGYAEEISYLAGRSAWIQGDLALLARTRLLARASWFMDSRPSPLVAMQSAGLLLSSSSDLTPWLRLRLSALGRFGFAADEGSKSDSGGSVFANLEARF